MFTSLSLPLSLSPSPLSTSLVFPTVVECIYLTHSGRGGGLQPLSANSSHNSHQSACFISTSLSLSLSLSIPSLHFFVCPMVLEYIPSHLTQVEVVVSNPSQRIAVTTHIDQLIRAVLMQMRMNFTTPLAKANDPQSQREVMDLGKKLTSCLVTVSGELLAFISRG